MSRVLSVLALMLAAAGCGGRWVAYPPVDTSEVEGRFLPGGRPAPSEPASAGGPSTLAGVPELTVDQAVSVALANRAELAALAAAIDAAAGRRATALAYPNPEAEVSGRAEDVGAQGVPALWLSWRQPIVLSDRRQLGAEVADAEAEAAAWEVVARELGIAGEVRDAFFEVVAAQELLDIATESAATANEVVRVAEALFGAERIAETEVLLARSAAEQQHVAVEVATSRVAAARSRVATAIGLPGVSIPPCRAPEGGLPSSPQSSADLESRLFEFHPELLAARARVDAAEREVERQQALAVPDLSVGASYGQGFDPVGSLWAVSVGMPIPLFDRNRGGIQQAEAMLRAAEADLRALEAMLTGQLREAVARYEGTLTALRSIRESLLPMVEESYRRAELAYREGKTGYLGVLDARRARDDARAAEVDGVRDARAALTVIELLAGPVAGEEETP